jgi:gamma-glutamylcyclotransferase
MVSRMSTGERWYFAYGSNLSRERMEKRTGPILAARVARLKEFRLAFNVTDSAGAERYANIVPTPGGMVWGVAYWCTPRAMEELDKYEEVAVGCYTREWVDVETDGGESLKAEVYIGGTRFTVSDDRPPSRWYSAIVIDGAKQQGLPPDYVRAVEALAGA